MPLVFRSDFGDASRGLRRDITITVSAVLCLGLGLGAATAIFSAVKAALIEPLPLAEPDRLVTMFRTVPTANTWPLSAPNYLDLARTTRQLAGLAAVTPMRRLVALPDEALQLTGYRVTGNFFPMLGARAAVGRLLTAADDEPGAAPVLLLGYETWRDKFGSDRRIVGRTLTVDGAPRVVVGVLQPRFRLPHGGTMIQGDAWEPMRFTEQELQFRQSNFLMTMGRLGPGASLASAEAELRGLFSGILEAHPELAGNQVRLVPLQAEGARGVRVPLLLLLGAVGFVLLIAATNVASLLLARGVQRRREMAVRTALGGSRWDVMRPVIAESLLLTAAGAALGLLLAWLGVRTIGALATRSLPQLAGLRMDLPLVGFAIGLALVVALVCAGVPAWRAASVAPQDALRSGLGGGRGRAHHRALHALVVASVALSLVLLLGAGLVLRGFSTLVRQDPGFDPAPILSLEATIAPRNYPDGSAEQRFLEPALAAIRQVPGVAAVGSINLALYREWGWNFGVRYEGHEDEQNSQLPLLEMRMVTPDFFRVTRQRLVSGRLLTDEDAARDSVASVVVLNEAAARRDFPNGDAVGKRFYAGNGFSTIVGVVSDIRNSGPFEDARPEVYLGMRWAGRGNARYPIVVRAAAGVDPVSLAGPVTAAIRGVDKGAAVGRVMTMNEQIAASVARPKFFLLLLGSFAVVAVALAVAGLYGVMSYSVAQRTREIGIRGALGSSAGRTVGLVARQGLLLTALGLGMGLLGGAALTRFLTSLLYGVSPVDLSTWLLATAALAAAAAVATLVPAARAARVDPLIAIREE